MIFRPFVLQKENLARTIAKSDYPMTGKLMLRTDESDDTCLVVVVAVVGAPVAGFVIVEVVLPANA